MHYNKIITLKDSAVCTLRNADFADGAAVLEVFLLTHAQTDNLLSYPDENTFTANDEAMYLKERSDNQDEIEILAEIDGKVVGTAGISKIGKHSKVKHRAEFGIGIDQKYWGLGIGKAFQPNYKDMGKENHKKQPDMPQKSIIFVEILTEYNNN